MTPEVSKAGGRRRLWSGLLGAAMAAVLLYYSLRGIEWARVWQILRGSDWRFVAAAASISTLTFLLRAARWRALLNAGARTPASTVFWAMMAGYLGNNFLPARAGELIRTFAVSKRASLSVSYVLTTALMERFADALYLVLCGSLLLAGVHPKPAWMNEVSRSASLLAVAGFVFMAALPRLEGVARRVLEALPLPAGVRSRARTLTEEAALGVRALRQWRVLASFVLLTILIWTADAAGVVAGARAVGAHLPFALAMLLLVGLGLGSALPSTPGYVGIFQFVAVTVLTPFGIDRNSALAFIILFQATGYLLVLILGLFGLSRLRAGTNRYNAPEASESRIQSAASASDRAVASGGSDGPRSR